MSIVVVCPQCDGETVRRGALRLVCGACDGLGVVAAGCVDCPAPAASVLCTDGQPRCRPCADEISGAARALLRRIAERPTEETVQRIIDVGLRLLEQVAR